MKKLLSILVILLLTASIVFADSNYQGKRKERGYKQGNINSHFRFSKKLDLTKDQLKKLEDFHKINKEQKIALMTKMKDARFKLRSEILKDKVLSIKVAQIRKEIISLHSKMLDQHILALEFHKKLLTPEQYKKLQNFQKAQGRKMKGSKNNIKNKKNSKSFFDFMRKDTPLSCH